MCNLTESNAFLIVKGNSSFNQMSIKACWKSVTLIIACYLNSCHVQQVCAWKCFNCDTGTGSEEGLENKRDPMNVSSSNKEPAGLPLFRHITPVVTNTPHTMSL